MIRRKRRWGSKNVPKRVLEARKTKRATIVAEKGFCVVRRAKRGYSGLFDKDGETILFRSALELTYFRIFQEDNTIESWAYEPERIPYTYHGELHKTVIDAIIRYKDGTIIYAEIKPSSKVQDELVKVKACAAIDYVSDKPNTSFKFLTELECIKQYQKALEDLRKK